MIAINKIHEQEPVFSLIEIGQAFGTDFLDESACRRWILDSLHGDSYVMCPECGSKLTDPCKQRLWEGKRVRCCSCGKFFTALSGTVLSGCHLDFRTVMLLAVFLFFDVKAEFIARKLAISTETVRLWKKKFQAIERMNAISGNHSCSRTDEYGN